MSDFLVALGLVFVLEGLLFAAFPALAKRTMASVMDTSDTTLRTIGVICAVVGIAVIWLLRG